MSESAAYVGDAVVGTTGDLDGDLDGERDGDLDGELVGGTSGEMHAHKA